MSQDATRHGDTESPYPPRSKPIRVEGGIRARTTRGRIGASWWSRRFLAVLESFELPGRLSRGRTYARQGQVLALEIEAGTVRATVQGSRATPYRVQVDLAPLTPAAWDAVEAALVERAIYCAQLLAGEMPSDIEDVFAEAGTPLFPQQREEVNMSCSCPDAAVPCKHLAAAFYLLAEAFDDDPFRILQWRGRAREPLLARLRALRAEVATRDTAAGDAAPHAGPSGGATAGPPESAVGSASALADIAGPAVTEALDRFWLPPVPLPDDPPQRLAADPDLLLRQLPSPGPALGGGRLIEQLRPAYRRFAQEAGTDDPGAGEPGGHHDAV